MNISPQFILSLKRSRIVGVAILSAALGHGLPAKQADPTTAPTPPADEKIVALDVFTVEGTAEQDYGAYDFDTSIRYTPGLTARQNGPDVGVLRGFIVGNRHRN